MDLTQIIVIISLLSISAVIVTCGIWLSLTLKELKNTLFKTNLILDDTKQISSSLAQPFNSFSEFISGFKNGIQLFNSLFSKNKKIEE
ncbi:MAG: hypothetical protein WC596_01655 [Candidatus Shapirobacteria bacterium]